MHCSCLAIRARLSGSTWRGAHGGGGEGAGAERRTHGTCNGALRADARGEQAVAHCSSRFTAGFPKATRPFAATGFAHLFAGKAAAALSRLHAIVDDCQHGGEPPSAATGNAANPLSRSAVPRSTRRQPCHCGLQRHPHHGGEAHQLHGGDVHARPVARTRKTALDPQLPGARRFSRMAQRSTSRKTLALSSTNCAT